MSPLRGFTYESPRIRDVALSTKSKRMNHPVIAGKGQEGSPVLRTPSPNGAGNLKKILCHFTRKTYTHKD